MLRYKKTQATATRQRDRRWQSTEEGQVECSIVFHVDEIAARDTREKRWVLTARRSEEELTLQGYH